MKDCIPWEGPHAGKREECEEERMSEIKHDELTHSPCHLEVEKSRVKLSLRRRER